MGFSVIQILITDQGMSVHACHGPHAGEQWTDNSDWSEVPWVSEASPHPAQLWGKKVLRVDRPSPLLGHFQLLVTGPGVVS